MWPVETVPTLILSPRGQCIFMSEFGGIEAGGEGSVTVTRFAEGQALHLSAREWSEYRKRSPGETVFSLRVTATHEAGHAIVAGLLGRRVKKASVFPVAGREGTSFGRVEWDTDVESLPTEHDIPRMAVVALSGRAADRRGTKTPVAGGDRDREEFETMLVEAYPGFERKVGRALASAERSADEVVGAAWPAVTSLAAELRRTVEVKGERIGELIAQIPSARFRRIAEAVSRIERGEDWSWLLAGEE